MRVFFLIVLFLIQIRMMQKLVQDTGPFQHVFTVEDTGLQVVTTKRGKPYTSFDVRFEDITTNKQVLRIDNQIYLAVAALWLLATGSMYLMALEENNNVTAFFLLILPGFLPVAAYFYFKKTVLHLFTRTGKQVKFFYSPREAKKTDAFLEQLFSRRSEYLKQRYGTANKHLPYATQFDWLSFLLTEKVISLADYESRIEALNQLFSGQSTASRIGFSASPAGPSGRSS
jgi:hypothetical protein